MLARVPTCILGTNVNCYVCVDCSLPGSSVHGILQARILQWVAISFFKGSSLTKGLMTKLLHCRQLLYHQETHWFSSVQFSSVAQSYPTLWDPMNRSTPGLPVHHQIPEFTQTHVHRVADAIQPSHLLLSLLLLIVSSKVEYCAPQDPEIPFLYVCLPEMHADMYQNIYSRMLIEHCS